MSYSWYFHNKKNLHHKHILQHIYSILLYKSYKENGEFKVHNIRAIGKLFSMKEFCGKVVSGKGEGANYVDMYNPYFKNNLGCAFFPGTLNIKAEISLPDKSISIKPQNEKLNEVKCYKVILNNKINAFVVVPQIANRKENIVEILSEQNLRKDMKLNDGDEITLKFIDL